MNKYKIFSKLKFVFFLFVTLLYSCKKEVKPIERSESHNFPSRIIRDAKIDLTDSIYTTIKLKSLLIEEYEYDEIPYQIFPKGLEINFWNKKDTVPGYLHADYAKIIQKTGWYEGKGHVVIVNPDKDTLKTNQIFWDRTRRMIHTNDTVRIYRADGVTTNISNNGIEATEDFKNFKLKNNSGTLPYKEINH